MVQRKMAIPAAAVLALGAGAAAAHMLVSNWKKNPDPLGGEPLRFPEGLERAVQLPDGALINTVTVGDGPTIVCVHGLTSNRNDWAPMAPTLLDAGFQLLAIDQRGHGGSTSGAAGFGATQLGDDLSVVFEALDVHAVALMGHSMGGMASMSYAVHHPDAFHERVDALVLVATAASLKTARHRIGLLLGGYVIPEFFRPQNDRLRVTTGLSAFGARPSLHMIDQAIEQFRSCSEAVRAVATGGLRDHDVHDLLDAIDVPTYVIGAERDQLIRPQQVRALADGIDGAELEMLDEAGHMLIWERHTQVAELVSAWLDQRVAVGRPSSDAQPDQDPT